METVGNRKRASLARIVWLCVNARVSFSFNGFVVLFVHWSSLDVVLVVYSLDTLVVGDVVHPVRVNI